MPKIRGVKPDYWTDEDVCEVSIPARLLFIGLWNYSCDNGHMQDKPKQIKRRILPDDEINVAELLRELAAGGLIQRSDGWIITPNLTKHQRPDKRYWQTCERPGCERPLADSQPGTRSAHHETTTRPPRKPDVGSMGTHVDGDGDGDGDGELKVKETLLPDKSGEPDDRFDEFYDIYAKKVDRKLTHKRWTAALKKPGVTADLLIAAAAAYVLHEGTYNEGGRYVMDPSRWLLNERWRDERPTPAAPRTRVQEHLALVQQLSEPQPTFPQIGPSA